MEIIKLQNDVITASGSLADNCDPDCYSSTFVGDQDEADEC